MLRLPDQVLDTVVYLYPSVADAEAGESVGGTGFLVGVPSTVKENHAFFYAVTVSHVVREGQSPVVRLNTKDGDKDVIDVSTSEWVHHQDGDDLAVCPLNSFATKKYRFSFVDPEMFLTPDIVAEHNIGPGDEVFMAGRFVTHESRQRNTPTARFGNVSMLPAEPVPHPRGIVQESFLVETRSLGGFSGAPVFVHIEPRKPRGFRNGSVFTTQGGAWLLGIDWAHLPIYESVKEKNKRDDVPEGWVVESNSGQMAVIPAWRLQNLLNQKELVEERKAGDEKFRKQLET